MLREQNNRSPITGLEITDPVLDHDHESGDIRAVLNRWENSVLGRIENWARRIGKGIDPVKFIRGVADYMERHKNFPSGIKYPTHKTEEEKRELRNKKAREARRKARSAE